MAQSATRRKRSNSVQTYSDRGAARQTKSNFKAALEDYNQAIKLNPSFAYSETKIEMGGLKCLLKNRWIFGKK